MNFGEKLLKLRKAKSLSQEQLAAELAVSRQAVSKWELGESLPDSDKLLLISKTLGVTTDYLLSGDVDQSVTAPSPTRNNSELTMNSVWNAIQRKGYLAGYFISGLAILALLLLRVVYFIFKETLTPPEGFGFTLADMPMQAKFPLYFVNVLSVVAIIVFFSGLVFVGYSKKKNRK